MRYYGSLIFHDYTLALDGGVSSRRVHDTGAVSPALVQIFGEMLRQYGNNFRKTVPVDDPPDIELSWASEDDAALAAFSLGGQIVTISALLSGRETGGDTRVLNYFQEILAEESRPRKLPAPQLAGISERPVMLSIPLPTFRPEDMSLIGQFEVCLAAAFFQRPD